jgi:hypothetical protein
MSVNRIKCETFHELRDALNSLTEEQMEYIDVYVYCDELGGYPGLFYYNGEPTCIDFLHYKKLNSSEIDKLVNNNKEN